MYTSRGVGSLAFGSRPPNGGIGPEYRPSYALALTGSCVGLTAERGRSSGLLEVGGNTRNFVQTADFGSRGSRIPNSIIV